MSDYILGTEERRRLELLEQYLDPITTRSLDTIGVEPGWRCLELGGGGGSVTRMLCERVGPAGRVAAVDLDTRFLEEIGAGNLDIYRQDIVADGLPGDAYHLIHARLLMTHLPSREKVLEQMAAMLRPGGWLLIEEMDMYPLLATSDGLFRRVWEAAVRAFETAGADPVLGRKLPVLFDSAGLEAVAVHCEVPTFRGGGFFTDLTMGTLLQIRPLVQANGITDEELEELPLILADPRQWFGSFAVYSVRGRRAG